MSTRQRLREFCTHDRFVMVLFFLTIGLASALSPMTSDTWWQLRAGGDMWASRRVLLTDAYSHTAFGAFWPNHEWLSQVIFFGLYKLGGLSLLSLATAGAIVAAWGIAWHLTAGTAMQRLVLFLPALLPASGHWAPRPHAFSFLFLMLAVWLVVTRRYLWLLPLFWLWANCHGGVLLGLVVVAAALGGSWLHEPRAFFKLGGVWLGCLAAATVTPLGVSFWIEIPHSLARIRQYPLDEWKAPGLSELPLVPFWVLAALFCGALLWRWRELARRTNRDLTIVGLSALVILPLALSAVRNVGPFLMLAVPALSRLTPPTLFANRRRQHRPALNAMLMTSAALVAAVIVGYSYRFQIPHLKWTPLPAASLQALRQCPDNLYNRYDEGGYLIWFEPGRRVFLDGRQDPFETSLVLDQLRIEESGDYAATFSRHQIRCAYLPVASPIAARLSASGWSTLYRDPTWVVLTQ